MKDFSSHFREVIERTLPADSRVLLPRGRPDMIILASWKMDSDAFRPPRRSRMIRIVISEEAIEAYARGDEAVRMASDERFIAWLREKLSQFDPNHDAPLGVEPPSVTWTVSTLELNG